MDQVTKLLIGSVARGVMWAAGGIALKLGIETISEGTGSGIATFIVMAALAGGALLWSKIKDKKLKESDPAK